MPASRLGPGVGWTISLRLTLLYGAAFFVSGALLLTITYLLVAHLLPWIEVDTPTAPGITGEAPTPTAPSIASELDAQIEFQRAEDLRLLLLASGIALTLMTVVSASLGWFMATRALRPLRSIAVAVKTISERSLHQRLRLRGPADEIKELADTFDGLLGRLEDAFEAQRRFVANASHELRTPLTLERSLLEVALADPAATAEDLRSTCERVLASNEDQARLIEALLTLARSQRGLEGRTDLDLAELAAGRGVGLETDLHPAPVSGDQRLLERMITNLADNALKHNVAQGWVRTWTGIEAGRPTLRMVNSGPVIALDQVPTLLQPFAKLENAHSGDGGAGLGLSIVAAIVKAHDASMHVQPLPTGGLDIRIVFQPQTGARRPEEPNPLLGLDDSDNALQRYQA